ncbi:molybdopterin-containing oxidoreductase family protein [Biformimicrobium ophioploci]|uniref:Molybdopterin-dependent oxidoreductase n=1 Tax=Biformimicrobium ophioploci TaxID=3036711 RepID=A0ABQ6M2A8_9GAMM|nr:molybdopterin-dependent oxidoreductase [Microbulbifer sp. NKW57]GMG88402.1 molybdopterin-dependent oxidoreductase [Microbulbifer sp. NKW57]
MADVKEEKIIKTYCRFCHATCPMEISVKDNKVTGLRPDTDNEVFGGYTCLKGRQMPEQLYHPSRIQASLRKNDDGSRTEISTSQALDEIAEKLAEIREKYGPRSIGSYNGTVSFQNSATHPVAKAWHTALESPSYYTSITIDQPAKVGIGQARMGFWLGGNHTWRDSDVALIIGNNTLVSHFSIPGGIPSFSPSNALREGKKRGLKIISVDPRRSEVAARSDIHLQIKPGQDAVLLAGLVHIILNENLHDEEFCAENIENLDALKHSIRKFTPDYVAERTDLAEEDILAAARMFAAGPRGSATTGTGPEMGPYPNLVQHLTQTLNAICGRHYRAGEKLPNPGVLSPPMPRLAQAVPPQPEWLTGIRSRVSDDIGEVTVLTANGPLKEMPTAICADEILMEGEGQIKALICVGGNPLLAWPGQEKAFKALKNLELLVCIDYKMSATAELADYVIGSKLCLERDDLTVLTDIWYEQPYSHYAKTVVEAEGDVIEEWALFWELGKRLGLQLEVGGQPLDMEKLPSKYSILEKMTAGSRVPLKEIYEKDGGHVFDVPEVVILPPDPASKGMLDLFPEGLEEELENAARDADSSFAAKGEYQFLLISRRMKNTFNSTGPELSFLAKKGTTNPAYIHPDDLDALDIKDGEIVAIKSERGEIPAVAQGSPDIKRGVVSMAHCWGPAPDGCGDDKVREIGANTNRLINNLDKPEKYSGMAQQSAVAVQVRKLTSA